MYTELLYGLQSGVSQLIEFDIEKYLFCKIDVSTRFFLYLYFLVTAQSKRFSQSCYPILYFTWVVLSLTEFA